MRKIIWNIRMSRFITFTLIISRYLVELILQSYMGLKKKSGHGCAWFNFFSYWWKLSFWKMYVSMDFHWSLWTLFLNLQHGTMILVYTPHMWMWSHGDGLPALRNCFLVYLILILWFLLWCDFFNWDVGRVDHIKNSND